VPIPEVTVYPKPAETFSWRGVFAPEAKWAERKDHIVHCLMKILITGGQRRLRAFASFSGFGGPIAGDTDRLYKVLCALSDERGHPSGVQGRHSYFSDVRASGLRHSGRGCRCAPAAISNDPMGNTFEKVTFDINFLPVLSWPSSQASGVKAFIFASAACTGSRRSPRKELGPESVTAYAKSKVRTEVELQKARGQEL